LSLAKISVSGYRSIQSLEIPCADLTILIGRNNSGKSNVLRALRLLLEGSPRDLSADDFHTDGGTRADKIEIRAEFAGVQPYLALSVEQHRPKLEKSLADGNMVVRRIGTRQPLDFAKMEIWQPDKGEFGTPTGIDAALKQVLPEVVFIEAFTDPTEEAQAKSSATLGKLLKQIAQSISAQVGSAVQEALANAAPKFNLVERDGELVDERADDIRRVEQRIRDRLRAVVDATDVRIKFALPEVQDLLSSVRVDLQDRGLWTPLDAKGQGLQRALYLALLQALSDELRSPKPGQLTRPFILLFEEPESFLHPALQRQMGCALAEISATNQVIIATHSPILVSPGRLAGVRILRRAPKEGSDSCATACSVPDLELLPDAQDKQLASLLALAPTSEFLFADTVLVVEGPSDSALLRASWDLVRETHPAGPACPSLAIIDAGSKHVLPAWLRYLRAMGFNALGLVDLDFLWDGAGKCLGGDKDHARFIDAFWKLAETQGLVEDTVGQKRMRSTCKPAAFAILTKDLAAQADLIRERLKKDHATWVLRSGEIEGYFGLTVSSKGNYVAASRRLANHEIPLDKEIRAMFLWATPEGAL